MDPPFVDDKTPICVPFILERLAVHRAVARESTPAGQPFLVGLNGVQGVGKTTLVRRLAAALRAEHGLETLVVSIDDFYLTHADQAALAADQPGNKLVQCRGQPGTHDLRLIHDFFEAICHGLPARVPRYDKSAFSGEGDRLPMAEWPWVNAAGQPKLDIVIVEGWCVGFATLSPSEVSGKWTARSRTLQDHDLQHLEFVNSQLQFYSALTELFDAFIHVDAEDTTWVYEWRLEQERQLRDQKGTGMTDAQVVKFVDAYYPAYELYVGHLRQGLFPDKLSAHLRIVVGKDRKVKQTFVL